MHGRVDWPCSASVTRRWARRFVMPSALVDDPPVSSSVLTSRDQWNRTGYDADVDRNQDSSGKCRCAGERRGASSLSRSPVDARVARLRDQIQTDDPRADLVSRPAAPAGAHFHGHLRASRRHVDRRGSRLRLLPVQSGGMGLFRDDFHGDLRVLDQQLAVVQQGVFPAAHRADLVADLEPHHAGDSAFASRRGVSVLALPRAGRRVASRDVGARALSAGRPRARANVARLRSLDGRRDGEVPRSPAGLGGASSGLDVRFRRHVSALQNAGQIPTTRVGEPRDLRNRSGPPMPHWRGHRVVARGAVVGRFHARGAHDRTASVQPNGS
jgi:hypothetical protein